jgi:hypothetical protein
MVCVTFTVDGLKSSYIGVAIIIGHIHGLHTEATIEPHYCMEHSLMAYSRPCVKKE